MDRFVIMEFDQTAKEVYSERKIKKIQKQWLKKLPLTILETKRIGETGKQVILPFSEETANILGIEWVEAYYKKIIDTYDFNNLYLDKQLRAFLHLETNFPVWLPYYMVFPELMKEAMFQSRMEYKDLRPVILDPGDVRCDYILEWLLPKLNYLTILTPREEYFTDLLNLVYENMGLVIQIYPWNVKEKVHGNFIIDMDSQYYKFYQYADYNATILDLDSTVQKKLYYESRRKDLNWLSRPSISMNGEPIIDFELASVILTGKSWRLSQFAKGRENIFYQGDMELMADSFQIEVIS